MDSSFLEVEDASDGLISEDLSIISGSSRLSVLLVANEGGPSIYWGYYAEDEVAPSPTSTTPLIFATSLVASPAASRRCSLIPSPVPGAPVTLLRSKVPVAVP